MAEDGNFPLSLPLKFWTVFLFFPLIPFFIAVTGFSLRPLVQDFKLRHGPSPFPLADGASWKPEVRSSTFPQ